MDDAITREPDTNTCPACPTVPGWIFGTKSAWQRSPRGLKRLPDVPADPVPCHRCNPDGRRPLPVAAPEPEEQPDLGMLMGGF